MLNISRLFLVVLFSIFFTSYASAGSNYNFKERFTNQELVKILKDEGYGNPIIKKDIVIFKTNKRTVFLMNFRSGSLFLYSEFSKKPFNIPGSFINVWNKKRNSTEAYTYISNRGTIVLENFLSADTSFSRKEVSEFINRFSKSLISFYIFLSKNQ